MSHHLGVAETGLQHNRSVRWNIVHLSGVSCTVTVWNLWYMTECLDELACLIEVNGISVCQPTAAAALKLIAQQIADRDNSVRSAALNAIVVAYHLIGENVFKHIGTVRLIAFIVSLALVLCLFFHCYSHSLTTQNSTTSLHSAGTMPMSSLHYRFSNKYGNGARYQHSYYRSSVFLEGWRTTPSVFDTA